VGEYLLRAIPNDPSYFKESMGKWAVDPYAFKPHRNRDADGMSFFRLDFATPKEVSDACGHPSGGRVVRLAVQSLNDLGLDVTPDPNPSGLAGHVIVTGMKFLDKPPTALRRQIEDLSQKLARLASEQIVFTPPGMTWPVKASK
jgi:hypothetical protein